MFIHQINASIKKRGIIKSRPIAGVKSSNFQFSRQVKDIKSSLLEELQTERSTVIASTRPAPSDTSTDQLSNKQTTPSLPDLTTALNTETSDQLVRRASLGKTNSKSGMCSNSYRFDFFFVLIFLLTGDIPISI